MKDKKENMKVKNYFWPAEKTKFYTFRDIKKDR